MSDKTCKKCSQIKPIDSFRKYWKKSKSTPEMKYWYYMGACKSCEYKNSRQWEKDNPEKKRERIRTYKKGNRDKPWYKNHLEQNKEYNKKVKDRDQHKIKARNKANRHIKNTPKSCSLCNKEAKLEKHHDDYNAPLTIRWVCSSCHKFIHLETEYEKEKKYHMEKKRATSRKSLRRET